jgi:hypothetical protein
VTNYPEDVKKSICDLLKYGSLLPTSTPLVLFDFSLLSLPLFLAFSLALTQLPLRSNSEHPLGQVLTEYVGLFNTLYRTPAELPRFARLLDRITEEVQSFLGTPSHTLSLSLSS